MSTASQTENVRDWIKRLGLFNSFYTTAILYNSVIFRVVAGVLGAVPAETVAIVTMLEYGLNCFLEVPLGYVADRIGHVKATIIGLIGIAAGLTFIYAALLVDAPYLKTLFIYLDGILLGISKPMVSGSFQAFYQNKIRRMAASDAKLEQLASASFTHSAEFGKHLPLIGTVIALIALYALGKTIGVQHAFAIGILLYAYVIFRIAIDARVLEEEHGELPRGIMGRMSALFQTDAAAQYATWLRVNFQLINSVISGYMLVAILRVFDDKTSVDFWVMLLSFTISTAFSVSLRGYLIKPLYQRLGEARYVFYCLIIHIVAATVMAWSYSHFTGYLLVALVFVYTLIFYILQGALGLVSLDILNRSVQDSDRATAISVFNMPGFLAVGLYGYYLTHYSNGAPTPTSMFVTAAVTAVITICGSVPYYLSASRT